MASIFKQKYTTKDKTGKTIRKQSKHWYIDYKTADGTRERVKGFKDKSATIQLAAELERKAELAQAGIVDKYAEHRKKPLKEHLDDFKQSLLDKGCTAKHAQMTYNRAKTVIEACNFMLISDISPSTVQRFLANKRKEGLSKKTSNYYLKATKHFFSWMESDSRMGENPLKHLNGVNVQTEIKHKRRALTTEELNKLIETTMKGPDHHGMTGKERAMLYILAINSGLRASELASLTWQSFNFDKQFPTITLRAAYSKHRREDTLPLKHEIAELFNNWQVERSEELSEEVFKVSKHIKWAKMLRQDLEEAEIPYQDSSGRFADFHALRHTYITNIVKSGASPKIAQGLARHSKISLTMDTYTHMSLHDHQVALQGLPTLPCLQTGNNEKNKAAALLKTGTDNQPVGAYKKLTKKSDFLRSFGFFDWHCKQDKKTSRR